MRNAKATLAAFVLVAGAVGASAQEIASHDKAEICATTGRGGSAYSRRHRTYRAGRPGYEHDHIVPLCLGGADTEANLQWQSLDEAKRKDLLEGQACRMVCRGEVGLDEAQAWFLGDWKAAYHHVFGVLP